MSIEYVREAIQGRDVRITDRLDEKTVSDRLGLDDVFHAVRYGEIIKTNPTDRLTVSEFFALRFDAERQRGPQYLGV